MLLGFRVLVSGLVQDFRTGVQSVAKSNVSVLTG